MILLTLAAIFWLLGFAVLYRIPLCRARGTYGPYPAVSVIVPARNEEHNLPKLLASLSGQDPAPAEIIVVNDESTDGTAAAAKAGGAAVVSAKPQPQGWRGKTWACWQGAEASTGEVLLFVDADTAFEPGGMRAILDTYAECRGAMSVGPYHRVRRPYEELSAVFNLVMTAGTGAFTALGSRLPPQGLFGQFLLVDRSVYFAHGGHESVRNEVLETYRLGARLRAAGVPLRCYGGKGAFAMRMYPEGLRSLIAGWTKSFAAGAASTPPPLLLLIIAWISGAMLAFLGWLTTAFSTDRTLLLHWVGLYFAYALQIYLFLARIGSFRVWTSLAFPIPLLFYIAVFTRSFLLMILRRRVLWKGRELNSAGSGK